MRVDCDAKPMRRTFLRKLDALRELWGRALTVTSGARCREHNADVGGAPDSQHPEGNAADLETASRAESEELARAAEKVGMGGIGVAGNFLHVDDGPQGRRWTYPTKVG